MVSHYEMEGLLRYRQLRNYANRRNIHVRQIRHLRDTFSPLEEYDDQDFRLRFRLTKDSVSDLAKILDKDLQHQTRRGLPLTPMQQVLIALRFYATGTLTRGLPGWYQEKVLWCCALSRCDRGHRLYPHQDHMSKQKKWYGICWQKAVLVHQRPSRLW